MLKNISRSTLLHPILFSIFPVIFFYSQANNILSFTGFVIPLFLSISLTFLIWIVLRIILKNKIKAALITSLFVILSLNIGHLNWISQLGITVIHIVIFFVVLLIGGSVFIIKSKRKLDNATVIINSISFVLIVLVLIDIATYNYEKSYYDDSIELAPNLKLGISEKYGSPDVYIFILDAHANHIILEKFFDYNNKEFINSLKDLEFFVPEKYTNSNYGNTELSVTSFLNIDYLNNLVPEGVSEKYKIELANKLSNNNMVMKNFESMGYKTIGLDSGWIGARVVNIADENLCDNSLENSRILYKLKTNTIVYSIEQIYYNNLAEDSDLEILDELNQVSNDDDKRQKIFCNFSELNEIKKKFSSPLFVFFHILSPHPPWVFDSDGKPPLQIIESESADFEKSQSAYIKEMEFIDKKIIENVRKIISESDNQPIIVILGDHGSRIVGDEYTDNEKKVVNYGNLMALYLPYDVETSYYKTTPVNIFRLIFNSYFNGNYEILENKVYYNVTSEITDWEKKVSEVME